MQCTSETKVIIMSMNLSGSAKERGGGRGGGLFSRVVIFLSKIHPPYT